LNHFSLSSGSDHCVIGTLQIRTGSGHHEFPSAG
jgi:hypothetical protein